MTTAVADPQDSIQHSSSKALDRLRQRVPFTQRSRRCCDVPVTSHKALVAPRDLQYLIHQYKAGRVTAGGWRSWLRQDCEGVVAHEAAVYHTTSFPRQRSTQTVLLALRAAIFLCFALLSQTALARTSKCNAGLGCGYYGECVHETCTCMNHYYPPRCEYCRSVAKFAIFLPSTFLRARPFHTRCTRRCVSPCRRQDVTCSGNGHCALNASSGPCECLPGWCACMPAIAMVIHAMH
eukprot:6208966-Pleurochrysis_carterae.AAC.2